MPAIMLNVGSLKTGELRCPHVTIVFVHLGYNYIDAVNTFVRNHEITAGLNDAVIIGEVWGPNSNYLGDGALFNKLTQLRKELIAFLKEHGIYDSKMVEMRPLHINTKLIGGPLYAKVTRRNIVFIQL